MHGGKKGGGQGGEVQGRDRATMGPFFEAPKAILRVRQDEGFLSIETMLRRTIGITGSKSENRRWSSVVLQRLARGPRRRCCVMKGERGS